MLKKLRTLWRQALSEHTEPSKIGLAFGVGAAIGCSPLIGLHALVALLLATALRLNRVAAFAGSNVSLGPLMPTWITIEVLLGAKLLGTAPPDFSQAEIIPLARSALSTWLVGYAIVGPTLGISLGFVAYFAAKLKQSRTK